MEVTAIGLIILTIGLLWGTIVAFQNLEGDSRGLLFMLCIILLPIGLVFGWVIGSMENKWCGICGAVGFVLIMLGAAFF